MVKEYTHPKYGEIEKSRVKFAWFPKTIEYPGRTVVIWLEKYVDYYMFTRSYRCDVSDYWKHCGTEIIGGKYGEND